MTILVFKGQRRQSRNHEEIRNTGQRFNKIFGEPLGDKVMHRITGEVAKGQHRDRRFMPGLVREVVDRSAEGIPPSFDLPAGGVRGGGASTGSRARIDTKFLDHRRDRGWRTDPYGLVDGPGLLGRRQVEHGQESLPATLEFANRLGAVAHLRESPHKVARGTLVSRLKVDQAPCCRRAYFRFRVLLDQAVEIRLEKLPHAILEPRPLSGEPMVERGRDPVEILEKALAVGLDEIADIGCRVRACIEDCKRIDPTFLNINSNAVATDLDQAGNMPVHDAVQFRK